MKVLGISAFYHDSAAALVVDGTIVAACQEERFTRVKHDASYPSHSVEYCLGAAGISLEEVDHFVFYEKPFLKFERLLETYFAFAPKGFTSFRRSMPTWFHQKLFQKQWLLKQLKKQAPQVDWSTRLLFSEHHLSHGASAFFPSPFSEAAVLSMDGVGEWTTTSLAVGRGNQLEVLKEIHFPHSLGLLYSAFTYYLGFKVNSGEYKVMGLAPYGNPRFADRILEKIIHVKDDGSFRLNLDYFDFCTGLKMTNTRFARLFGEPRRAAEGTLSSFHMDVAASIQKVIETVVLRLSENAVRETGLTNLCLAGGVALNCVANGRILEQGRVKHLWIQPAAGDAGGALGAALAATYLQLGLPRSPKSTDGMDGAYLGPAFSQGEVERKLTQVGAVYAVKTEADLIQSCVAALRDGNALGWFQGRMEFGPRALGARSILADPRSSKMQALLNQKIKYRESFRPFAPMVLREDLSEWFDLDCDSPYMLLVGAVTEAKRVPLEESETSLSGLSQLGVVRSQIPAVTHVDDSARVQTVDGKFHPRLYHLLRAFKEETGCPVLVNTSFNVRGEPMVCSPEDAFRCFMGTELDLLAVEDCLLWKADQVAERPETPLEQYALD